ncbi:YdeI/OmpD-associated family protein [Arthrobacter sp. MAHUQ-56]
MADNLEELLVPDAAAWRAWLEENHGTSPGVWLVMSKKGGTVTSLDYQAALDEALCFGWIDGQGRRRDIGSMFVRMTPRRPRSTWSARNVGHVARLEAEGKMTDAGRAAVAAAKADGRWDAAYGGQADVQVPPDLAAAIAANPAAKATFDILTKTNLFSLVYRTNSAKQAATRERRIAGFVDMLARGETPYPQKRRAAGQD